MKERAPTRRLGLRREGVIILSVALLLVVALSVATLLAYREAIDLLIQERRDEATRQARSVAEALAAAPAPSAALLRQAAPHARQVAVLDAGGVPIAQTGRRAEGEDLLAPLDGRPPTGAVTAGPGEGIPDGIAAFLPLGAPAGDRLAGRGDDGLILRLDLSAGPLAAQRRSLRVLTLLVVVVDTAVILTVLLFLRRLLAPYETLLERAREAGAPEATGDEVEFLVATFERALAALARPAPGGDEDISALGRTLAPSLESGVLLLDREGGILALNPAGASLLEVAPPAPGASFAAVLPGGDFRAALEEAVGGSQTVQRRECAVPAAAGTRTLGLTVYPLRREGGGLRGFLALFADLTAVRRQAEEERLVQSLAQLGELAAGVAHELRNSLATLKGYLALLERRPEAAAAAALAEYLPEIRRESDHLERVVRDFLAFAHPGTARVEEVDLVGLLHRAAADPALEGVEVRVGDRGGDRVGEGVGRPRLRGDAQLLDRAFRNLLRNAAEAGPASPPPGSAAPPVEVTVRPAEGGWEVLVEDRGSGLPPEVRERLFQPFVTTRPGGVGLGLALAHRIVSLHGGRLRLEDRPGGGTRAVAAFPGDAFVT